jgi:hypothetical protein
VRPVVALRRRLLWRAHLREGIADDGSPTGIEHAFRLESFQPHRYVLRSRWRDRALLAGRESFTRSSPDDAIAPGGGG